MDATALGGRKEWLALSPVNVRKKVTLSCGEQAQEPEGAVRDLHSNFSRLVLAIPNSRQGRMDHTNENAGLAGLKKNIRCLYEMVAIGIIDNKEIAQEIKNMGEVISYTSYQISNRD